MNRFATATLALFASLVLPAAFGAEEELSFSRDVRPILSDACFRCHGPDEETREAELRLDQRGGLFDDRDGYAVVTPGDIAKSELVQRLLSDDPDVVMPPPDSKKKLTKRQRDILIKWVEQGAAWERHWSFEKPQRPVVPQTNNANWPRNEIDRFILKRLESADIEPSSQADAYTLVRRLYLDLVGLPPTPQEADQWVEKLQATLGGTQSNSTATINETAFQDLVTHLLASPHYGERWARRWLDLARYADTNGYEKDRERTIWPYRDWVINAINDGMPFDRFTIEQLAGDMLPNATVQQKIATGFHRNTMLNEEGGIDPLEFRFHAMTDRVATTGTTWLGLTLGCCQCHTHKYDPISHHEYYQLMAYLNNADEPLLELPDQALHQRWQRNKAKADEMLKTLAYKWPVESHESVATQVVAVEADSDVQIKASDDGRVTVTGPGVDKAIYSVELELPNTHFDSLRLEAFAVKKRPGPGRTKHGNFVLSEIVLEWAEAKDGAEFQKLQIDSATADVEQDGFPVAAAIDGDDATGWGIHGPAGIPKQVEATFRVNQDLLSSDIDGPVKLRVTLKQLFGAQHTIESFRFQAIRSQNSAEVASIRSEAIESEFKKWLTAERPNAVDWQTLQPTKVTSNLPILTVQPDNSIFASGDTAKRDDYYITFAPHDHPVTALRLEALPDERLPNGGPGSTYYEGTLGDFFLNDLTATSAETVFPFASASQTYAKNRFGSNPATAELAIDDDVQTGWSVHDRQGERHIAVFILEQPVPAGTPLQLQMTFGRHFASSLGRFKWSAANADVAPQARLYSDEIGTLTRSATGSLSDGQRQKLFETFLLNAPQLATHAEEIRKLRKRPDGPTSLVMAERPTGHRRPTFRHHRGEYLQPKDQVSAGLPEALFEGKDDVPENRLKFAEWLVSKDNPLTARVVVNRHWATLFGTGLVKTVDDFGLQGESPSHPDLLDWLAVTFIEDDEWSIRKLHRRIVSSATYRQASIAKPEAAAVDPGNRLLSYLPRFRLDAEIVRDQLLVAADVLSPEIGGPPVRPPQPTGVTEAAYGKPKWNASSGADRYRRSIYTFTKRTAPFAMFATFDGPTGEACIAERDRSNSPLQALTLLNDVMTMDLARQAGRKAAEAASDTGDEKQVTQLFRRVLVRPPTDEETASLIEFLNQQRRRFAEDPAAAGELLNVAADNEEQPEQLAAQATWTSLSRAIFGLDEAMNRE